MQWYTSVYLQMLAGMSGVVANAWWKYGIGEGGDYVREGGVIDIDGKQTLSKRLKVGLVIFDEIENGNVVYFNKLVQICEDKGIAARATVSKSLDSLFDKGILCSSMVEMDNRWTKQIRFTNEGKKFFKHIRKELKKMEIDA